MLTMSSRTVMMLWLLLLHSAVQSQKAVSAYFTSKQILPFGFAGQHRHVIISGGNSYQLAHSTQGIVTYLHAACVHRGHLAFHINLWPAHFYHTRHGGCPHFRGYHLDIAGNKK